MYRQETVSTECLALPQGNRGGNRCHYYHGWVFSYANELKEWVDKRGTIDSLEVGENTTITGGNFTECSLAITGSSKISNVTLGEVTLHRDATYAELSHVTITGSLEINLGSRVDAQPTFKNCIFQGNVTITDGISPSSVTFEDSTFEGTVTLIMPVTITMNRCKLKNAPTGTGSSRIYSEGGIYTVTFVDEQGAEVTCDFEELHTISDKLFTTLQNRKDLSLRITFTYKGRNYETTFPAGADYTELLEDEASFYGLLGLSGRCGIVTRDVTPEEQTAQT